MITDILVAIGIGAVIIALLYFVSASARTAQKGNAPVAETVLTKKEREQQKQEAEEKKPVAVTSSNNNNNNKKAASSSSPSPKSSSPSASSNTSSPKQQDQKQGKKSNKKKSKKELDAEEEAEMDAFVAQELKRAGGQGIRKEKFEVINLADLHAAKEQKHARAEKKSEGAHFSEKQIASEKAAGFRVVGAQEAAKKEAKEATKSASPASRDGDDEQDGKKRRREAMTREEELDMALRSVLGRRAGKKGGNNNKFGGGFSRRENKDEGADGKGFVDIKGEVKASRPGGAWGRQE